MAVVNGSVDVEGEDRRWLDEGMLADQGGESSWRVWTAYSSDHGLFCRCRTENFLHSDFFEVIFNTFFCDSFPDLDFHLPHFLQSFFFRVAGFLVGACFVFEFEDFLF